MKYYLRVLFLLGVLLVLPLTVSAQDAQTIDLNGGYSITLPAGWSAASEFDNFLTLESDDVSLILTTPTMLETMGINFSRGTNVFDVLINLTTLLDGVRLERSDIEKLSINGRTAAAHTATRDGVETRYVALTLSDGAFAYFTFIAAEGDLEANSDEVDAIITSLDSAETATDNTTTTRTTSAQSETCTVRTTEANSAELRVGPGTNRGVISFLPVNIHVTATGRIELQDGSIWYQLDKTEAAPNGTPASELWVAEAQVILNGDCANVGVTNAPPVIRAAPQVIPTQPAGESGTSTIPATPDPGLLQLRNGTYTMTLAPVINASCTGGQNVPLNTSEVYEGLIDYTYYVEVVDANSFYYNDDLFRRYPGSNSFDGIFTYEGGEQSPARIDVLSSTSLHGEINDLFPYAGVTCSATLLFNATRN